MTRPDCTLQQREIYKFDQANDGTDEGYSDTRRIHNDSPLRYAVLDLVSVTERERPVLRCQEEIRNPEASGLLALNRPVATRNLGPFSKIDLPGVLERRDLRIQKTHLGLLEPDLLPFQRPQACQCWAPNGSGSRRSLGSGDGDLGFSEHRGLPAPLHRL